MNKNEKAFAEKLIARGWTVYFSGWPDFLCMKERDGKLLIRAIELKGLEGIRPNQVAMHKALERAGLRTYTVKSMRKNKAFRANRSDVRVLRKLQAQYPGESLTKLMRRGLYALAVSYGLRTQEQANRKLAEAEGLR